MGGWRGRSFASEFTKRICMEWSWSACSLRCLRAGRLDTTFRGAAMPGRVNALEDQVQKRVDMKATNLLTQRPKAVFLSQLTLDVLHVVSYASLLYSAEEYLVFACLHVCHTVKF